MPGVGRTLKVDASDKLRGCTTIGYCGAVAGAVDDGELSGSGVGKGVTEPFAGVDVGWSGETSGEVAGAEEDG